MMPAKCSVGRNVARVAFVGVPVKPFDAFAFPVRVIPTRAPLRLGRAQATIGEGHQRRPHVLTARAAPELHHHQLHGGRGAEGQHVRDGRSVGRAEAGVTVLATGRRQYTPLLIRKRIDKATPLIAKADKSD